MGAFDFIGGLLGTNSSYKADENKYGAQTGLAGQNSLDLQKQLMQQILSGQSPEMAHAADTGMAQNASLLGSAHGISPAAFVNALQQANSRTQGQMAGIGAAGQLGREQLLGQASGQMYGQGLGFESNAQQTNANTANQNAKNNQQMVGGLLNGGGGAAGMAGSGGSGGGGAAAAAMMAYDGGEIDYRAQGGHVPGQAQVEGDAPQNDTVPAKLSPGEIVIPRSVAQSDDAPDRAAAFVEAIKASGGKDKEGGKASFSALLAKHRELDGRLKRLEKFAEGGEVEGDASKDDGESDTWKAVKSVFDPNDKDTAEKISKALPDWLSGHSAVEQKRARLARMDRETGN